MPQVRDYRYSAKILTIWSIPLDVTTSIGFCKTGFWYKNAECCGELKSVFRIRIHVDPYWIGSPGSGSVLGIRIRIQDCQNGVQKGTNLRFQVKKSIDHFAEGLMVLTWAWKSPINVFKAIRDWKKNLDFFFSFILVMNKDEGKLLISNFSCSLRNVLML